MAKILVAAQCVLLSGLLLFSNTGQSSSLAQQRADFLRAEKALKQGHMQRYYTLAANLKDYPLYPHLQFQELSRQLHRAADIQQYLQQNAHSRYAFWLRRKWLKYTAAQGDWPAYLQRYEDQDNTKLKCYYHWAQYKTGQAQQAFAGAQQLWTVGHSQPGVCDPLFSAWRAQSGLSTQLVWERFDRTMQEGNLGFAGYLKKLLPARERKKADFWLKVHKAPQRVQNCTQWSVSDPIHGRIFAHGITRLARRKSELAQQIWSQNKHSFALPAETVGRIDRKLALKLAVRGSDRVGQALTEVHDAGLDEDVRGWRVRAALKQQDWNAVLKWADELTPEEQNTSRWRYWRARALDALGYGPQARIAYAQLAKDRSFYGFLAADRLQLPYAFTHKPVKGGDQGAARLAQQAPFKMVQEWRYFKRRVEGRRIWWDTIKTLSHDEIHSAARLAHNWGWDQVAIFTIAKAKYWDDLELRFPLAYRDIVSKYARQSGLEPSIVYGLIRQESAFNDRARSPSGALGLMQIMPKTGQHIARMLHDKHWSVKQLRNPDTNVRYGTTYYQRMLKRFDDSFALAAAAYNAGPHRVDQWLPADKSMPADIWVETIPFNETRHYVKAVLEFAVIYQQRMDQKVTRKISSYLPDVFVSAASRARKKSHTVALKACAFNLGLAQK